MCLAVPMKVLGCRPDMSATVEAGGISMEVNTMLVYPVEPGEYVLVHAGYAIQTICPDEARETLMILNDLAGTIHMRR